MKLYIKKTWFIIWIIYIITFRLMWYLSIIYLFTLLLRQHFIRSRYTRKWKSPLVILIIWILKSTVLYLFNFVLSLLINYSHKVMIKIVFGREVQIFLIEYLQISVCLSLFSIFFIIFFFCLYQHRKKTHQHKEKVISKKVIWNCCNSPNVRTKIWFSNNETFDQLKKKYI